MAALDLAALTLGCIVTSGKGAKSAPLTAGGAPALWAPPGLRAVAFEPRPYAGGEAQATRVNLVLRAGELEPELRALDAWAVEAATAASTELFGKAMTREQVAERYTPLLKESDKYPATWRVKIGAPARPVAHGPGLRGPGGGRGRAAGRESASLPLLSGRFARIS